MKRNGKQKPTIKEYMLDSSLLDNSGYLTCMLEIQKKNLYTRFIIVLHFFFHKKEEEEEESRLALNS